MPMISRRRVLQGTAGALLLPQSFPVFSQSGVGLLRAPKHALVIGNSAYKDAPLKNPANDAKAIGEELKKAGFQVAVLRGPRREPMLKAIQEYAADLAKSKSVGLFYFAGHG